MVASLLIVLAVTTVRSRFDDPDMWWHMKMGEIIWTTHVIPSTDIFSFTTNHHAYIAHEWLSQVLIYGAYRLGGYSGLMLWLGFFTSALFIGGYALCSLYSGSVKVGFLGAMIIWQFATIGLAVRPQMIGYLLLIAELLFIEFGRTRNPRWFLALPPLFAIWVNCHGSFFLGIVLAGAISFSSYVNFQHGALVAERWNPRSRRMLSWSLVLSVAALFVNPVGVRLVLYPLDLMLRQPVNIGNVQEWQPLRLTDPRGLAFLGILGFIFVFLIVRKAELKWTELLMLMLGTWLAASHERMLFVFGILAAPILSRLLAPYWDPYDARQERPLPNAVLIAASLLIAFWTFPNRQSLEAQVVKSSPAGAVAFIRSHHLPGPVLNEYVFGGYLIWSVPELPVFIDGRTDIFEKTGVLQEYGEWATLRTVPDIMLDKYHINFCLLRRDSPMTVVLQLLPNWKSVYSDNISVIFVRASPTTS
jgi:hypothetical protein